MALVEQRAESERLGHGPIEASAVSTILRRASMKRWIVLVDVEAGRHGGEGLADLLQALDGTPVWPRRGSSSLEAEATALSPLQAPSSQSALLGL